MLNLCGKLIFLRALEPADLDFLYTLENETDIWEISGTLVPYSKHILKAYLANSHRDIYEVKQLRLCICEHDGTVLGLIDLFDYDPRHHRAGLGIIVLSAKNHNKGIGSEAISLVMSYAFSTLAMRQLYANVSSENEVSLHIFKKLGFKKIGTKKDWNYANGIYKDEILLQCINRDTN